MAWSASNLLGSLADKVSATSKAITGITANLGDLVIVGGQASSGGNGLTGFTVADSGTNAWTVIQVGTTGNRGFLAYCIIAAGKTLSAGTITVTRTGTTNITAFSASVVSFTGGVTSSIEDSAARATANGTGTSPTVTSGTPSTAGDLFVGVFGDGFSGAVPTFTEASGWTNANNLATAATNGALGSIGYQVNAGTGTLTHNPTLSGAGTHNWAEIVTAFLVAPSGGFFARDYYDMIGRAA